MNGKLDYDSITYKIVPELPDREQGNPATPGAPKSKHDGLANRKPKEGADALLS